MVKISEKTEYKWEEKLCKFIYYLKKIRKIEDYNQVAFLFRSVRNYRALRLMEAMETRGIPVYSPRSNMFFKREEIKFFIGLFLMIFPQSDKLVFDRAFGGENYYGECYAVAKSVIREDAELIEYIQSLRKTEVLPNFLGIFYGLINTGSESIKKYVDFSENHILKNRKIYNFGIMSQILSKFDELCSLEKITKDNVERIVNYFFNTHLKFLKDSGMGEYENMKEYAPKGAVSFLTVHQGKGLEFPCVIVGSLEEYPTVERDEVQGQLELALTKSFEPEYRIKEFDFWRTYYTAFSRAKNLLALTCIENSYKPVPSIPFKPLYEELYDVSDGNFEFHKLNFEEVKEINIKEIFSFTSHINLYKNCPRLYKIQKKYEFVLPKNKGMIFGNLVHETLEDINREIYKNRDNLAEDFLNREIIKEKFENNYKNILKKYKIKLSEDVLQSGAESIIDYYENFSHIHNYIKDIEIKISFVKDNYIL